MKLAVAHLVSASNYTQGKHYEVPKLDREQAGDYEMRTWRNKMHTNDKGDMVIPGIQFKRSLEDAAKYLNVKIPGQRNSTYTKHFEAGVMVLEDYPICKADDVKPYPAFVPSTGIPGSGQRVQRLFPIVPHWEIENVTYHILDEILTKDVFLDVLKASGMFIGIGTYRPRNRGVNGRFQVKGLKWLDA